MMDFCGIFPVLIDRLKSIVRTGVYAVPLSIFPAIIFSMKVDAEAVDTQIAKLMIKCTHMDKVQGDKNKRILHNRYCS